MITRIEISGFKSFHNFEMTFSPLTVVAGANASGKSNLFDALKLLSRLAETDLKTAFSEQRGDPTELFTQYGEDWYAQEMTFVVDMLVNRTVKDNWGGKATLNNTRLRYSITIARELNQLNIDDLVVKHESLEKIKYDDDPWVKSVVPIGSKNLWKTQKAGGSPKPFIQTEFENGITTIKIRQDGRQGGKATPANTIAQTVLGGINSVDFPHAFAAKEEIRSWKFLRLNPEDLRDPTRKDIGLQYTISEGGKNLASALYRIKSSDSYSVKEISRTLNSFLPNFVSVDVLDDDANRQFIITVTDVDGKEFTSRVLSEGTLRLLALCILLFDGKHNGLLCFEEPENGIHPFRMEAMVSLLIRLSTDFCGEEGSLRQVIVNTHSPVILKQVVRLGDDRTIEVWYSNLSSLITKINQHKVIMKIAKMVPVIMGPIKPRQLGLFEVSESEMKRTIADVTKYLETDDLEKIVQAVHE